MSSNQELMNFGFNTATNNWTHHVYILKNVLYERNKLYVLGLSSKTTKDCVLNFIARISGCDVKRVLMFKFQGRPSGRAIVTLDTEKITNAGNQLWILEVEWYIGAPR